MKRPFIKFSLPNAGFTLIELVVIITILGVLAVTATARFTGPDSFSARAYADELAAAASYAQRYAVASGCTVRFQLSGAGYSLAMENPPCDGVAPAFGTTVQNPGGGISFSGSTPSSVTLSAGAGNYDFNAYGDLASPVTSSTVTVAGGGVSASFVIEGGSGYVNRP